MGYALDYGIGQGLNSFADAFINSQKYQDSLREKRKQEERQAYADALAKRQIQLAERDKYVKFNEQTGQIEDLPATPEDLKFTRGLVAPALKKRGMSVDELLPEGMSQRSLKDREGLLEKFAKPEGETSMLDQIYKMGQIEKQGLEKRLSEGKGTVQERRAALNDASKMNLGNFGSAIASIAEMRDALKAGDEPLRIDPSSKTLGVSHSALGFSDNKYSAAERVLNEVIGRLQSGGAIGVDEGDRFKAMGPRPGDDPQMRIIKLNKQYEFLTNKIRGLGFKPEELESLELVKPGLVSSASGLLDKEDPEQIVEGLKTKSAGLMSTKEDIQKKEIEEWKMLRKKAGLQ